MSINRDETVLCTGSNAELTSNEVPQHRPRPHTEVSAEKPTIDPKYLVEYEEEEDEDEDEDEEEVLLLYENVPKRKDDTRGEINEYDQQVKDQQVQEGEGRKDSIIDRVPQDPVPHEEPEKDQEHEEGEESSVVLHTNNAVSNERGNNFISSMAISILPDVNITEEEWYSLEFSPVRKTMESVQACMKTLVTHVINDKVETTKSVQKQIVECQSYYSKEIDGTKRTADMMEKEYEDKMKVLKEDLLLTKDMLHDANKANKRLKTEMSHFTETLVQSVKNEMTTFQTELNKLLV
jgi:hypothetical protein